MDWRGHIEVDSAVLAGKPVIRGTRLAAEFILELLAAGQTEADLLEDYPRLTRDDIRACIGYGSHLAGKIRSTRIDLR